jgi:exosortase
VSIANRSLPVSALCLLAVVLVGLLAALAWAFWPTLAALAETWSHDPQYSHGFIVPLYSVVLLWLRRDLFPRAPRESWQGQPVHDGPPRLPPLLKVILRTAFFAGLVLAAGSVSLRLGGTFLRQPWLAQAALPVGLVGVGLALGPLVWRFSRSVEFCGLLLVAVGLALRLGAAFVYQEWLGAAALLPCLAGIVLLAGGWRALRWSWPAILFLLFMIPLPYRVHLAFAQPLQFAATYASVFMLETVGIPAYYEGNIIILLSGRLGIEEVCSGLAMLMTFFALATAMAIVLQRPLVDRIILVLSAIPVAFLVNVLRITVTGVLYETVGREAAMTVFHDWAAWFMIPLALGMFALVLMMLSRLFREQPRPRSLRSLRPVRPLPA